MAISEFQKLSLSTRGQVQNLSYQNEFYLHENKKKIFVSIALNGLFSPLSLVTGQSERALELKELENNL